MLLRLAREADYRLVYRTGSRRTTDVLTLHFMRNSTETIRLGLAVGRRFGTAVVRNRLRRRIREAVRAYRSDISRGYDLIVSPRGQAAAATYAEMYHAVGRTLVAADIVPPLPTERQ